MNELIAFLKGYGTNIKSLVHDSAKFRRTVKTLRIDEKVLREQSKYNASNPST